MNKKRLDLLMQHTLKLSSRKYILANNDEFYAYDVLFLHTHILKGMKGQKRATSGGHFCVLIEQKSDIRRVLNAKAIQSMPFYV